MGQPKKKTSSRRTGQRRSHLVGQLARAVNRNSPIKVHSPRTRRQLKRIAAAQKSAPAKSTPEPKVAAPKPKPKTPATSKKTPPQPPNQKPKK